jgi:coenzyme F420-reducing hydrogenase beta subunit/polysaccharide pyruvyl transferase WcaK-like protein
MVEQRAPTIVTIGAAFSANKGAAAMLQAVIDSADEIISGARVVALTTYPVEDAAENHNEDVELVSLTPAALLFPNLPLALLIALARKLGMKGRVFALTRSLQVLMDATVVADLAGISFSDGRGIPTLGYNVLMTGVPLLVGAPVVKCAQALGSFEERLNRLAARLVLPHVSEVVARGERTMEHLTDLGLTRIARGADLAFLMDMPESSHVAASSILAPLAGRSFVAVSPSSVVRRYCDSEQIDYVGLMAEECDRLVTELDLDLVLLAHSTRPGRPENRMNDLPVCRDIAGAMNRSDRTLLLDRSLPPAALRAIIARSTVLVTSRFHAMISGLATATPTVVIGWSHKYREVMSSFGLEDWVLPYRALLDRSVASRVYAAIEGADDISDQVKLQLAATERESASSIRALNRVARPEVEGPNGSVPLPGDLGPVIASDMCIGCGACAHADPTIRLELDEVKQIFQPSHPGNASAAAVCPAVAVDYAGLQKHRFPSAVVSEYGVVESVMLAQSTNEERNVRASSGGIIKEVLAALLEQPEVDGVIALAEQTGLEFAPDLITRSEQVDELPGSIYHNLPKDKVIELLRRHVGRYVLVGIPCEFEGIFQYIYSCAPELEDRIHSTVGLICGWQYSHHAIRAICEFKGIEFDEIERISYRGGGPVGKLHISAGSEDHAISRRTDLAYQVAFDRTFNTPRCHVCINHSNFLADIVIGDAWLPSTVTTRTGISLIINRTRDADDLMRRLNREARIELTDVTVEEIKESQKPRIVFGDMAYAYSDYRRRLGLHTPVLEGPNRPRATAVPADVVESFHSDLQTKLALQRARSYRRLYWRKCTIELPRLFGRYWEWFSVRILRTKSLTGERRELPHAKTARFR